MRRIIITFGFIFCLWVQGLAQNSNELANNEFGYGESIYCNPILIDGEPLDYQSFNLSSTGSLALVSGNPTAATPEKIPFYVQLRRNGNILPIGAINFLNDGSYEVEISQVLAFAEPGDQLIINPTRPDHWMAKRIIKLVAPGC